MLDKKLSTSVAAFAVTLVAGALIVAAIAVPTPAAAVGDDTCSRDLEGVTWFFDPCVPEGAPLPLDVVTALEEDRRARECLGSRTPTPEPSPSTSPSPCPSPSFMPPSATPPPPSPSVPEPSPSWPEPLPTSASATPSSPTCAAASAPGNADPKLTEADKDKLCPPGRNPTRPVVLVATGDSLTSAHVQIKHYHEPKKCGVNKNTLADHRGLPGNDMNFSYAGRYVNDLNRDVVEYYNFARTGMGTPEILRAPATYKDACENPWARAFPPIDLAAAVAAKAKQDGRLAYYVTTGGINNTNWTDVAKGVAMCGMADFLRVEMVKYFIRNNLPLNAVMRYYDLKGKETGKDNVIKGGACQVVLQENIRGNEITSDRLRFEIPAFDGPGQYAQITRDVGAVTGRMINAGADKVVWMGYYDITPAKVSIGTFASQYVQNTKLPDTVKGALPDIPNVELDLIPTLAWKTQVKTWTNEINKAIKDAILAADPIVRFQPAPALGADKIQKTMIGGCPHPNAPGHDDLAKALDTAFKALR